MTLVNNLGQEVLEVMKAEVTGGAFTKNIDVSTLPKGIYTCKIETASHTDYQKIVIQ